MIGDWQCVVRDASGKERVRFRSHYEKAPHRDALLFSETSGSTHSQGEIGYSANRHAWYEYDTHVEAGQTSRQELFGGFGPVAKNTLRLDGTVRMDGGYIKIRTFHTRSSANAYRFAAEGLANDGTRRSIEVHGCRRSNGP